MSFGLKNLAENLDFGNDLKKDKEKDNDQSFERERNLDTCAVAYDIGISMLELEDIEFMFTFHFFENPHHYQY